MKKYPEYIIKMVRQNLGLKADDTSIDKEIKEMSNDEVFQRVCEWDGLIGYGNKIKEWYKDIYEAEEDRKILLRKPISNHPADKHHTIVLALFNGKQYVTWEHNSKGDSYYWGHYFGNNQEAAIKDYLKRGSYKEEEE